MECNKDEAIRAKDIAVRKFTERDFPGAKKFALKAQALYPGLEGISHMLTTLEVYISAENKINGEMDMYGILGVNPQADDETIKKHYRKLVLLLHPDKNKSIGADGAFQLVSEAFNFLSDKAKRAAYNSRRHVRTTAVSQQQKVPPPTTQSRQKVPTQTARSADQKGGGVSGTNRTAEQTFFRAPQPKVPPTQQGGNSGVNGYHKPPPSSASSRMKPQKNSGQKPSTQAFFKKDDTFWTVCNRCKMQYEYMRVYLNQTLKCPHCQEGFMAREIPPPSNLSPIRPQQQQQHQRRNSGPHISGLNNNYNNNNYNNNSSSSFGGASARWSPFSGTTAYGNNVSSSAPATNVGPQKREREESNSGFDFSKKRREDDNLLGRSFGVSGPIPMPSQTGIGNRGNVPDLKRAHYGPDIGLKYNFHRELPMLELRKMLMEKALTEIRVKLGEWKLPKKAKQKEKQKPKVASGSGDTEQVGPGPEMVIMSVPDPDFHVFDSDRSETCFGENQVWASYDNTDGMPRFYALIHEVISLDPFKVKLSWLNSKTTSEFGPLDWTGRGFVKTCGEFRVGRFVTNDSLNAFSHKVKWAKGPRGVVQIYPQKGDIWALYRNWAPDWSEDTPENIVHAYDMVEVLEDYNEEKGVSVAPIFKASGFRTVFYKQKGDPKEVKRIPKEEMFRFSHRVPSYVLTGEEKPNAPKGYVELDPAATPPDLLQVISPEQT